MNTDSTGVRVLVALALGLAALSGVSTVMRALGLPEWAATLAVLLGLVAVISVVVTVALRRDRSRPSASIE